MPTVKCAVCPRTFDIPPSHLERLKRPPTCSPECKASSMRGKGHWHYREGRYVQSDGYVMVLTPEGYQAEHRVKMEKKLGRKLRPDELVKHKNEDRADNRLANLYVVRTRHARRKTTRRAA